MVRILSLLLAAMVLGGCAMATQRTSFGNFTHGTTESFDQAIANDVLKQLIANYPPAKTQFDFQQPVSDALGKYLVTSMRINGYAVKELHSSLQADPATSPGVPIAYVVDRIEDLNLYRVTLVINKQQTFSRVYQMKDGSVQPAGYWARKE